MSDLKTITRVYTQKKSGRYNIDLDGKFAFGVGQATYTKFLLFKDSKLSDEQIVNIKKFDKINSLKNIAFNFLSGQLRTEKEIVDKLKTKEPTSEVDIKEVLIDLKELGYVDDLNFAESLVRTQIKIGNDGPKAIEQKLYKKGVSKENIQKALLLFDEDEQIKKATKISEKISKTNFQKISDKALEQKIYSNLLAKGFLNSVAKTVVDNLKLESTQENQIELIKKQILKIENKYEKYGKQKRFKIKTFLYSKGFQVELIEQSLTEIEEKKNDEK